MALDDNALVTWEETKDFLELSEDKQAKTEFLINSISARIEKVTGRKLKAPAADETVFIDGDARASFLLPEFPVISITSLYFDASRVFGDDTAIESTEYKLDKAAGIIKMYDELTPEGAETIKVVLKAGYSTIPYDLKQAIFETIRWNLGRFGSGAVGFESLSGEGMNYRAELTIPTSAWQVIMGYQRPSCV